MAETMALAASPVGTDCVKTTGLGEKTSVELLAPLPVKGMLRIGTSLLSVVKDSVAPSSWAAEGANCTSTEA